MTATATYGTTSDPYLNGVLSGVKWGTTSLTFSFPTSSSFYGTTYGSGENTNNFAAFTTTQADAVRNILKMYASYSNLTFTEVTESATVHGELRYAESDSTNTAWAYYPSTNTIGGDAWFNNSKGYYNSPAVGNYGWLTMMHETGHALGLKHPHEASGSFAALPTDHDSLEYSVMSYRSYVGASTSSGYTNGSGGYPQTLMMYDIAAIQKMYGANYTTNAGDTVYSWSASNGAMSINGVAQTTPLNNKIFMTLWDGGGNDTYSFAGYTTGVSVDLAPGSWTTTSSAQLAYLGNTHYAVGNIANALLYNGNTASLIENAVGGSGADAISGNQADNKLTGGAGNDTLDGRTGNDTAIYSGASSYYSWVHNNDDSWTVTDSRGTDGTDTLWNIEFLKFADQTVDLGGTTTTTTTTTETPPTTPTTPTVTNTAPTTSADFYTTGKNAKLTVAVTKGLLVNDADAEGQSLSAVLVSKPSRGTLSFNSDGSFIYTPQKNYNGIVTFTYKASDGDLTSATTTVTIGIGTTASKTVLKMKLAAAAATTIDMSEDQAPGEAHKHGNTAPSLWNDADMFHLVNRPSFNADSVALPSMLSGLHDVLADLGGGHGPADNLMANWSPTFFSVDHFII